MKKVPDSFFKKHSCVFKLCLRTTACFFCVLSVVIFLTSCQPTPEVPPMVNRSEGLPTESVIEPLPLGQVKGIDAPSHWKENMERREGAIKIDADVDIAVPDISNTPVVELKQMEFTDERLKELVSYFMGGSKLYKIPELTKAELEGELEKMENKEGNYLSPYISMFITSQMERTKELIESAPQTAEKEYLDISFTYPAQDQVNYIYDRIEEAILMENAFKGLAETGDPFNSEIKATKYDDTVGSTSCFAYRRGIIYTETDKLEDEGILKTYTMWKGTTYEKFNKIDDKWSNEKTNQLNRIQAVMDDVSITPEWAQEQAQKVLDDLGITGMGLEKCEKGVQFLADNYQQYRLNRMDIDLNACKGGYSFTYFRESKGLLACILTHGHVTVSEGYAGSGFPNAPPFYPEYITIFVGDGGVQGFEWENMSQITRVVAENTKLLPFDQIKERFADSLNFNSGGGAYRFEVNNVELRLADITAYNVPANAWLIPVWVFEITRYDQSSEEEVYLWDEQCQFNAIDGGFVAPAGGGMSS